MIHLKQRHFCLVILFCALSSFCFTPATSSTARAQTSADEGEVRALIEQFFAAYANRSAPSIVALGALEEGQSGSAEVAPMLRRIMEAYMAGSLGPTDIAFGPPVQSG